MRFLKKVFRVIKKSANLLKKKRFWSNMMLRTWCVFEGTLI